MNTMMTKTKSKMTERIRLREEKVEGGWEDGRMVDEEPCSDNMALCEL